MKLSGNTIFITGGSEGIGRSLAKLYMERGNKVIVCARDEDKLKKAAEELPGLYYIRCDINNDADRRGAFEYVTKKFPDLNVLINNAAIQSIYDLKTGSEGLKNMDLELSIGLNSPIHMTGLFMPHLLQAKDPAVVYISSILGFMPLTYIPMYCGAKAGLHAYILVLRKQLEKTPIKVYEVAPPKVETKIHQARRAYLNLSVEEDIGLDCDEYCNIIIEEMGKGVQTVFHPPTEKFINEMPRSESEILRLA